MAVPDKTVGRNWNRTDTAFHTSVLLNAATSTTLVVKNTERIYLLIQNLSNQPAWLKLQAADIDDLLIGIYIPKSFGIWRMPTDNIYTGEISAIAVNDGPTIHITEY